MKSHSSVAVNDNGEASLQRELRSAYSAVAPMLLAELVQATILILMLAQGSEERPRLAGAEILALVGAALVFPLALRPLVDAIATTLPSRYSGWRQEHINQRSKSRFGFDEFLFEEHFASAFTSEERARLGFRWDQLCSQYSRGASYLVAAIPVVLLPTLMLEVPRVVILVSIGVTLAVAALGSTLALRQARGAAKRYWDLYAALLVERRFDVLRSLEVEAPARLSEEPAQWALAARLLLASTSESEGPISSSPESGVSVKDDVEYSIPSGVGPTTGSLRPERSEPLVPIGFDGYVWASLAASNAATSQLTVWIGAEPSSANATTLNVQGRKAPRAPFRIVPDADGWTVKPSEMLVQAKHGADTKAIFVLEGVGDGAGSGEVWLKIYQYQRLVANVRVNTQNRGEDGASPDRSP